MHWISILSIVGFQDLVSSLPTRGLNVVASRAWPANDRSPGITVGPGYGIARSGELDPAIGITDVDAAGRRICDPQAITAVEKVRIASGC
ncbi:hypothetical protein AURDEDRAFT_111781 [Auricularia subglabra TFB-10046 SS5]|nr:hypothetical protein AURDEDRAFT_111781 [Auricularia subglabra TFB-10046 SS5]